MEKKFNIVVGEDGTVKLPDAVLEKLEVKPGEEVRFEVMTISMQSGFYRG